MYLFRYRDFIVIYIIVQRSNSIIQIFCYQFIDFRDIRIITFFRIIKKTTTLYRVHALSFYIIFQTNRKIEKIDLEGNWIESQGSIYLAQMLGNNIYITELVRFVGFYLSTKLGPSGARASVTSDLNRNDVGSRLDPSL